MTTWSFISVLMVSAGLILNGTRKRLNLDSLWWMRIAYTAIIVGAIGCAASLVMWR